MMYFIADPHFDHENILKMTDRPFGTTEEMNETIIKNWNSVVTNTDTVYILGDMFFRTQNPERILMRLKGKKHLIIGNHDESWMKLLPEEVLSKYFVGITNMEVTSNGEYGITLCHYPMPMWKHRGKTYMIHGHIHDDTSDELFPYLCRTERILNAGVEINGFRPVTLEELIENNKCFKSQYLNKPPAMCSKSYIKKSPV